MTAYDVSEWADFANTVAGGAAALAGLLFVALSLNLAEVLKYPGVPARAAGHARAHHRHTADGDFRRDSRARPSGARRGDRRHRDLRSLRSPGGGALPARGTVARPNDVPDIAAPRPCGAADRGRCVVVATARRRPVLGNRFCHNGFCRRIGKRVGAARRNQTVAGPATRARFRLLHQRDPVGTTATPQMFATTGCS